MYKENMSKKKLMSVVIVTMNRKEELTECLESIFESDYKPFEVVVVDNASTIPVSTWLPKRFPKVRLITSKKNLGAAGGRNLGLKYTKGEYILFMDDDATADKQMINELVKVLEEDPKAGIVQPKIYDKQQPNVLQGVGHGMNLTTGRVYAWGVREKDRGQYGSLREIPMAGCVWMVKREVFDKIGRYDEVYFIPYEDSDFSWRARKAGFKVFCVPRAKAWHQGPKKTFVHPWLEWFGITSPARAYRVLRNKIIFMRKHAQKVNLFIFLIFWLPLYLGFHSLVILALRRFDILRLYWRGVLSGLTVKIEKDV